MTTRSVVGSLLLFLVAISVLQVALDGAGFRTSSTREWRAPAHHPGTVRLPRRNTNGIPMASPRTPIVSLGGSISLIDCPDVLTPLPAGIFVPPRV